MNYRIEKDSLGEMKVPINKYWAAQTQRSFENFKIGTEKMPIEVIRAFAIIKKAAAITNHELGLLDKDIHFSICSVTDEILDGKLDEHFPLSVWQTGSGTQSNMNVNEVIANRASEIINGGINLYSSTINKKLYNQKKLCDHDEKFIAIHPNDHVNKSQSSNDTFPTAMHIAALISLEDKLLPALSTLKNTMNDLSKQYLSIVKTGRTHLQDATPVTLGQEISAWYQMLNKAEQSILKNLDSLREIALGGTAVGTGLNAPEKFSDTVAKHISNISGKKFISAENKFHSLTSLDAICTLHGILKSLACDLIKIANDVRWLASGPRCGIGEINIPANEPGSSIMPGKVNPTQCEALSMVCAQVLGNDVTIGFAASQGNFQLNVYLPVTIYNFLQSTRLLTNAMMSFNNNCAIGITPNTAKIEENLNKSLMLVTALNTHIGYDNAAKIAKNAHEQGITLRQSAIESGLITAEEFDNYVNPKNMV